MPASEKKPTGVTPSAFSFGCRPGMSGSAASTVRRSMDSVNEKLMLVDNTAAPQVASCLDLAMPSAK
jgi:hypothetical protein